MVNKPTRFNPERNPEIALEKRNQILKKISRYDIISEEEADSLYQLPIDLNYNLDNHNEKNHYLNKSPLYILNLIFSSYQSFISV